MKRNWKDNLNVWAAMINISVPIIAGLFFVMEINAHNKVQDERIIVLNERITGIQNDVAEIKKEFITQRLAHVN